MFPELYFHSRTLGGRVKESLWDLWPLYRAEFDYGNVIGQLFVLPATESIQRPLRLPSSLS